MKKDVADRLTEEFSDLLDTIFSNEVIAEVCKNDKKESQFIPEVNDASV